jgi:hypothetical protein
MYGQWAEILQVQGMEALQVLCQGIQGDLQGDYGDTVKHFALVLDERLLQEGETKQYFVEVLLPSRTAGGEVQVLPERECRFMVFVAGF